MDIVSKRKRSWMMGRVRQKNTPLERTLQSELRKRKVTFRLHRRELPGTPDIVFPKKKVAVFVDGDFWHGWRLPAWERKLTPFWRNKLRENRKRDARNFRKLRVQGWKVIRIWQHQLKKDSDASIERIQKALRLRK